MTQSNTPKIVATLAAVATSLVLFNTVAKLADSDRGLLLAAKIAPAKVAVAR